MTQAGHNSSPWWGLLAGVTTALLWVLSIPPFDFAEAAYIAFVPLLLWLYTVPRGKVFWFLAFATGWASWFSILIWLRHVTWVGTILLSAILALLFVLWVGLARFLIPRLAERSFGARVLGFAGLAGFWVFIEWMRTWLFWGFPWAPLALSQWERPVVLQISAWSGAYGVSFLLIFFNCCVAQTLRHRFVRRERKMWTGWFSPDLYMGMACLGLCLYVFFYSLPKPDSSQEWFTAGVVQPYIAPELKWDSDREKENLQVLEKQTRFVASLNNDVLLWPEAAAPWPVIGYPEMNARVLRLTKEIDKPILMGGLTYEKEGDLWHNGVTLAYPSPAMSEDVYRKRELVPFGEYVPKPFHFIVEKFVPLEGNFSPGSGPALIALELKEQTFKIGSLVCYEDVFPALARESARAGAQVFFVATNNAWYGEEGGAEQHAAHSVLRAVENRRPVMRCGNGGWSGWIDAYGTIRDVLYDENGSIYFRGGGSYTVSQYSDWARQQSFYTRHGDWFVGLGGVFAFVALLPGFRPRKSPPAFPPEGIS
ncbi:apolipoprotein N-acyltransferase [Coraliomargarita sinensis]|uniref:Apolipoprotein N-acyltransferase n=1 Tax=Coraliomargarita sinensis TaxID=2174842 RepID=A0A317ZNM9_9BACT|nr:apolipoprotein N-acyltransferase [Coraliomargarita sinensis]PXA05449.1 apolipoprotein N-acyltransferase [Coraliomargarita sinensis]